MAIVRVSPILPSTSCRVQDAPLPGRPTFALNLKPPHPDHPVPDDPAQQREQGAYVHVADTNGDIHPGCSTAGLSYTAASIPGYPCAAKAYPFPDGVSEDTSKPIVRYRRARRNSRARGRIQGNATAY